jgi:hypothetical protein
MPRQISAKARSILTRAPSSAVIALGILALDQPHVAPVRGDDQAVGLDDVDGEQPPE